MSNPNDMPVICPKCGEEADEVTSTPPTTTPKDGQQYAWPTKLSCGCTVNTYLVWYDEMGWV